MNLKQLRERFWWTIGDNPANPLLVDEKTVTQLINDGLKELADILKREVVNDSLAVDNNGRVTLPDDFITPVEVTWNGAVITPVEWYQKPPRGGNVQQYTLPSLRVLQLHDAPLEAGDFKIRYTAYPPELVDDNDAPNDVPYEYHEALATVYARAQYAKSLGYTEQYRDLSALWEGMKYEMGGVVDARISPVVYDGRWEW